MSTSALSVETGGVVVPAYPAAGGALMRALEHAASIVVEYSDDEGEHFAMQMIFSVPVAEVPVNWWW